MSDRSGDIAQIQTYWNENIHDLEVVSHPVGTTEFFAELAAYRFDKLKYLPERVDFGAFQGTKLLEIGCGVGIDLVRFAAGGARVTGIDLAERSIELARQNLGQQDLEAELSVMDGEAMEYPDNRFDVVYAHGVLQYTADPPRMVSEILRVLKPGGQAILMVYNRVSWLNALSRITGVPIEHQEAPFLHKFSPREFRSLLGEFSDVTILTERFPVPTKLHQGLKAVLYNELFVRAFNLLPQRWVQPFGWHLMAFARAEAT